jgi:LysR family transcriptional activator of mexEF-oprN operon
LNPKNFDNVNLNLLVIFAVLMRERSVTRASKILMISQPAVSHALKQLRTLFADPLFTRSNTGVKPTEHAQVVHKDLLASLEIIEAILKKRQGNSVAHETTPSLALPVRLARNARTSSPSDA